MRWHCCVLTYEERGRRGLEVELLLMLDAEVSAAARWVGITELSSLQELKKRKGFVWKVNILFY